MFIFQAKGSESVSNIVVTKTHVTNVLTVEKEKSGEKMPNSHTLDSLNELQVATNNKTGTPSMVSR